MITTGNHVSAEKGLKMGIIDKVKFRMMPLFVILALARCKYMVFRIYTISNNFMEKRSKDYKWIYPNVKKTNCFSGGREKMRIIDKLKLPNDATFYHTCFSKVQIHGVQNLRYF